MGAATFAITGHDVHGNRRIVKGDLTFSASYATGGDTLNLATEVGLKEVRECLVADNSQGVSIDLDAADPGDPKFIIYTGDGVQATNATDQSAITVPVWLFGTA